MTNHPGRRRGDDEERTPAEELAAEVPAVAEMADAIAAQMPPGHTPNGVPPGLRADAAKIIGQSAAAAMAEVIPQALFSALTAALSQVPVQVQRPLCATCIIQRIAWENTHRAAMDKAIALAAQTAVPGGPAPDLTPFLPEAMRPGAPDGMPGIGQSVTVFQGTETCPVHLAQAAGVQPGRSALLVASAAFSPAMLGQLAGSR
jgi:hypothetical protein